VQALSMTTTPLVAEAAARLGRHTDRLLRLGSFRRRK
jgi:hypothetical protein